MTANPLAGVFGSPISGALLELHGGGLSGWQWMFLIEGLPAITLGAAVFWTLCDHPKEADWLRSDEKEWLLAKLVAEQRSETPVSERDFWKAIISPRIWLLSMVYFGLSTTMYGITLWLPSVIRSLSGLSYFLTGAVAVLPFLVTVIVMVLVGMRSDRVGERRWHTALPAFTAAAGLVIAAYGNSTFVVVAAICVGMAFAEAMGGPFWAMATSRMSGLSAAAGIAVINSLANLGGYFGPDTIGKAGFRLGLLAIAATVTVSGTVALFVGSRRAENWP
jgi:ACS family tartrate transporter-like MFS transporter